jgi:hypothetical protein
VGEPSSSDEQARDGYGWLARCGMLVAWAIVVWGGLLLLVSLGHAVSEGVRPALARLLPSPGTSAWGWLNALSVGLALAAGFVAAGVWVWGRVAASKSGDSGE